MLEPWHRIYYKRSPRGGIIDVKDYCPRCWDGLEPHLKLTDDTTEIVEGAPHPTMAECSECEQGPQEVAS